jgi:hypothetical protein
VSPSVPVSAASPLAVPRFEMLTDSSFVEIAGNDLSDNNSTPGFSFGIRFFAVGPSALPASVTPCASPPDIVSGHISASVHDNRIANNQFGVIFDGGFPFRNFNSAPDCRRFEGSFDVAFANNTFASNISGTSFVAFTRNNAALNPAGLSTGPTNYQYLQNARFTLNDPGNELAGIIVDHPVADPIDGRTLGNRLFLNGVEVPAPTDTVP